MGVERGLDFSVIVTILIKYCVLPWPVSHQLATSGDQRRPADLQGNEPPGSSQEGAWSE